MTKQVEMTFMQEKNTYIDHINKLKGELVEMDQKVKLIEQRLLVVSEENRKLVEKVKEGYKEL
jgi:hypothetical protein